MKDEKLRCFRCERRGGVLYLLEEDHVGWYLIVYKNKKSSQDYLFDNLDEALIEAKSRFGIEKSEWKNSDTGPGQGSVAPAIDP